MWHFTDNPLFDQVTIISAICTSVNAFSHSSMPFHYASCYQDCWDRSRLSKTESITMGKFNGRSVVIGHYLSSVSNRTSNQTLVNKCLDLCWSIVITLLSSPLIPLIHCLLLISNFYFYSSRSPRNSELFNHDAHHQFYRSSRLLSSGVVSV